MHVGDTAVQRVFDRDHRTIGTPVAHRVDGIFEAETGQRQAAGKGFGDGDMAVRTRRALKGDGAFRLGGGGGGHRGDDRAGGGGVGLHGAAGLVAWGATGKRCLRTARGFPMGSLRKV